MGRASEYVPSAPFANWLNDRLAEHAAYMNGNIQGAVAALALECGWGDQCDGGVRKLYRFRKQLREGSKKGRKGPRPTDDFPRAAVEEALFYAGVPFEALYPDIAQRETVELEPEAWCPGCQDTVSPINGQCPFCDWRVGPKTGQKLMGRRIRKAA